MSGHVVVAPVVLPSMMPAALGLGIGLGGLALAVGVRELVLAQVDAAQRKAEEERKAILEWEAYQDAQRDKMETLRHLQSNLEASEQQIAAIQLGSVAATEARSSTEEGYLDLARGWAEPEQIAAAIRTISSILDSAPPELGAEAAATMPRLMRQMDQILARCEAGDRVSWEEAENFRTLVQNTIRHAKEQQTTRLRTQGESLAKLDLVLREALELRVMARGDHRESLDAVCNQLTAMCTAGEVKPGQLELLEKHVLSLKTDVSNAMLRRAYRTSLGQSIERHLGAMGYASVQEFPKEMSEGMAVASLRIPGGDIVRLAIHPNAQLAGELIHESLNGKTEFKPEDLLAVRAQEKKWCSDFKELVRRLVADGFQYNISFEQEIPESSIQVVAVETGEEIARKLAEEEDEEQRLYEQDAENRYLE